MISDFVRFMRFVRIEPHKGSCWEWMGNKARGYGHFSVGTGQTVKAHRWIYEKVIGPIPSGMQIRHHCDNPSCVNPDHITPGTAKENIADKYERGRAPDRRGEKHPMARLGADDVLTIRSLCEQGVLHSEIAERYGIVRQTVGNIKRRRIWRHI